MEPLLDYLDTNLQILSANLYEVELKKHANMLNFN